jgi:hypothetical protein
VKQEQYVPVFRRYTYAITDTRHPNSGALQTLWSAPHR